ncbi:MAG: Gfo/Idh/MocA family oxidoreductase [Candidatus Sungiibacteriota bacterium]
MKKTLAFGLIGAGYFGKHYMRLLQDMPGAVLRAVADRSLETIKKNILMLPPSVRQYAEAEDVFSDSEIDCVVIATPAASHCELVVRALGAGKHVLVEKPMAMNREEAEMIRDAVEKSGKTFMVGHQYVYNDHIRHLKKKLDEGLLGGIKYIFAEHFSFGPMRSGIGCFAEMAVHELSLLDHLFSPGKITDVRGGSVDFLQSGREDFAAAEILFESGLTAVIAVSWFAPEKIRRMTIAGDQGMAVFDDRREEKLKFFLHPYSPASLPKLPEIVQHGARGTASQHYDSAALLAEGSSSRFMEYSENEVIIPTITGVEPLRNQLEHFISCAQTGAEPISGIAHGLRVAKILDEIMRQMK